MLDTQLLPERVEPLGRVFNALMVSIPSPNQIQLHNDHGNTELANSGQGHSCH